MIILNIFFFSLITISLYKLVCFDTEAISSNYILYTPFIKKEYTIELVNTITPLIYEGFKSLYDDAIEIGECKDVLLIYQSLLKRIPKWSTDLINRETHRIRVQSKCTEWFDNLVRAVIKSNIMILNNNSNDKTRHL